MTDKADPLLDEDVEPTTLSLRIKSFKDVEIHVPIHSNVEHVKEHVRNALGPASKDRYMRLICKGRLLAPDSAQLREFSVQNGDVLHAVLAAAGVRGGQQAALSQQDAASSSNGGNVGNNNNRRRHRGTIIGPGGRILRSNVDSEDDSTDEDEEQGNERMGFDRLRASGLSRSEITAIRAYFSRHVDRHVQQHPNDHSDEPDPRRRRWMQEDDWMSLQGPASEFRLNLNQNTLLRFPSPSDAAAGAAFLRPSVGTDRDFVWGFLLGFLVGFVMLVWVWMPTVPHKQKLGILTGISFQLAMNVLRQDREDELVEGD